MCASWALSWNRLRLVSKHNSHTSINRQLCKQMNGYFQYMKSIAFLILLVLSLRVYSQELVRYKLFPCKEPLGNTLLYQQGVFSNSTSNDSTLLKIGFVHNCGSSLKPQVISRGDTLFLMLENTSDIYTSCDCYFKMDLIFAHTPTPFRAVVIDQRVSTLIQSKYIDFPPNERIPKKQIRNKTNEKGLKTGYWRIKGTRGFYYISNYGDGNTFENTPLWIKCYSDKNELISFELATGPNEGYSLAPKQYELILKEISEERVSD